MTILVDARFDDYLDLDGASSGVVGTGFAPIWLIQAPAFTAGGGTPYVSGESGSGDGVTYPQGCPTADPNTGLKHATLVADPAGSGKTVAKFILDPLQVKLTGGYLRSECTFHTGNNNDNNAGAAFLPNSNSSDYWYWYSFYMPIDWNPGMPVCIFQLHDLDNATSGQNAWTFTVSGVTVSPTAGATYTHNGVTWTVSYVSITAGSGKVVGTTPLAGSTPLGSGTMTKTSGTGDATLTFSASADNDLTSQDPTLIISTCNENNFSPPGNAARMNKLSFRHAVSTVDDQTPTVVSQCEKRYVHVTKDLPLGRWVELVVNLHAHQKDSIGKLAIWLDRRKVYQQSRRTTYSDEFGVGMHIGLYGYWGGANLNRTILYSKGAVIGDKNYANFNAFMSALGWPKKTELESVQAVSGSIG